MRRLTPLGWRQVVHAFAQIGYVPQQAAQLGLEAEGGEIIARQATEAGPRPVRLNPSSSRRR